MSIVDDREMNADLELWHADQNFAKSIGIDRDRIEAILLWRYGWRAEEVLWINNRRTNSTGPR